MHRTRSRRKAAPPDLVALHFPGLSGRIVMTPDPALRAALGDCLAGWIPASRPADPGDDAVLAAVSARQGAGGARYHLQSRYLDRPSANLPLASAVCALVADLSQNWAESHPDAIGLHCGALRIGGRLVLLTGRTRAGKSTLVTRLGAEPGVALFCDDVLPVVARDQGEGAGEGIALGIAPRLRLPVPAASARLRALARDSMILSDDRYGYVRLAGQAPHGTRAGLGSILFLDRRAGAPARLHALDPAEALSALLRQTLTGFDSGAEAFERVRALTAEATCLRLVYSDLDEAAALITGLFAEGGRPPADFAPAPALPPAPAEPFARAVPADHPFRRAPQARLRRHGGAAFLWRPGEAMLWELNPIGHLLWQMLETPGSAADLAEVLAEAFPDVAPDRILQDTARLLAALEEAGLVRPL
ncbi:PqqD family protein [Pseudogemmobacter sonorensis]|uniref:PqqD family protein n=1 Tax=Pseudogemmobacter sonorensis TaxID=2989681 RepID=UPI0036753BF6